MPSVLLYKVTHSGPLNPSNTACSDCACIHTNAYAQACHYHPKPTPLHNDAPTSCTPTMLVFPVRSKATASCYGFLCFVSLYCSWIVSLGKQDRHQSTLSRARVETTRFCNPTLEVHWLHPQTQPWVRPPPVHHLGEQWMHCACGARVTCGGYVCWPPGVRRGDHKKGLWGRGKVVPFHGGNTLGAHRAGFGPTTPNGAISRAFQVYPAFGTSCSRGYVTMCILPLCTPQVRLSCYWPFPHVGGFCNIIYAWHSQDITYHRT